MTDDPKDAFQMFNEAILRKLAESLDMTYEQMTEEFEKAQSASDAQRFSWARESLRRQFKGKSLGSIDPTKDEER